MIDWFARNRVAANLLMLTIASAGLLSLGSLRQVVFPLISLDKVVVHVAYPGATPSEVEQAVCLRIEEALYGLGDVKRTSSRAVEGWGTVIADLELGANPRRAVEEIQARVGALRTLPAGVTPPVVEELIDNSVLLSVVLYGASDEWTLRHLAERVRDDLAERPGISQVDVVGVRSREISIEVSEAKLRSHGLRFHDVAAAVRTSSIDGPGGALRAPSGEVLLRTADEARRGRDLERRLLLFGPEGSRLRLGDVARVVDGFSEGASRARMDGQPAVVVRVLERNAAQVLETSRSVRNYVREARASLPPGVDMIVWDDDSTALRERRDLLLRNGLQGMILVVLVLGLFLGCRLAFWVALGIPVAFLGALFAMRVLDVSLNMVSLFAFIVALGLVVDDAIVVGERIVAEQARGRSALKAAIAGARSVALPVVITVATTVVFVLPTVSSPGFLGQMSRPMGIVLIACLCFSLIESLLVLPAHLAHGARRGDADTSNSRRSISARVDRAIGAFVERRYLPVLHAALAAPGLTLAMAAALCAVVLALPIGGWVPFSFLPPVEGEAIEAEIEYPQGTPEEVTWAALASLEAHASALTTDVSREFPDAQDVFVHMMASVGQDPSHVEEIRREPRDGHVGRVRIELSPSEERALESRELAELWRARVGDLPGAPRIRFDADGLMDAPAIDLELSGRDPVILQSATAALKQHLAGLQGVHQIDDSHRPGKRELRLVIRPEGEAVGLTQAELARQVRQGFQGELVQTLQRGRDPVPVVVRYPLIERQSLAHLEDVRVRTADGIELPLPRVARIEATRGPAEIRRSNHRRIINVSADVYPAVLSPADALADVQRALPGILAAHPGVGADLGGNSREEREVNESRNDSMPLAILVAYVILAISMRSYLDPLLILIAIPFGLAGAVAAHAILGLSLSGFSIAGTIALMGVVVNDSLVLLYSVRQLERDGNSLSKALYRSCAERFRPILLTSLTTFFGLLPLLFETSNQAAWLKPVAAALAVGVLFATTVTLLVVPAATVLLDDTRIWLIRRGQATRSTA
jgi:multidrug efflux pump subunit AcrB